MKKVGFIDYYLDEWHANNYPQFIHNASNGRYEVCCAYAEIDSPHGGLTTEAWGKKYGIEILKSIDEVIEKSDVLIVLSPDNPEMHEKLTELPLKSGKLVYIDKTFAPDRATAERIFANADRHGTPCYSSSALRFSSELAEIDCDRIHTLVTEGPGVYEIYSIHQIEPIVTLMRSRATRVMYTGTPEIPSMIIEFADGRHAHMRQCLNMPFKVAAIDSENRAEVKEIKSDYFGLFIEALIGFFDTGVSPVPHEQTVDVIAIREAGLRAMTTPFVWVEV